MKMNKLFLFVGCFILSVTPVFAGELYELEEYLSAINVDNPYEDVPPITDVRPPAEPSSDKPPDTPPNDSVPDSGQGSSGSGDNSDSYGSGNFNQSFGFGFGQGSQTNQNNQNRKTTEVRDYLTQATRTNLGGFSLYRSRGKRHAQTKETACLENVFALPKIPHRVRKVRDKQVAYKKVQKSVNITFEGCFKAALVSADYLYDGFEAAVFVADTSAVTVFNLCV
jgi:hypothetical protein